MRLLEHSRNIPTLDGWRAIAILLVLIHHFATGFAGTTEAQYWATNPGRFGTIGVALFFGLSGLLICKLFLQEFDGRGSISFRNFYLRRAFRILPAAWVFLLTVAVLHLVRSPLEIWSCVAFFRNYVPESQASTYTAHLWSLAVEEHFYLFWPILLSVILLGRGALFKTVLLALSIGLWRSLDSHLRLVASAAPALDSPWRSDYRLDGLVWGCVAAFLMHWESSRNMLVHRFSWYVLAGAAALFCTFQVVSIPLSTIWVSILIPLMMVTTASHPAWSFCRFMDLGPVRWAGRISYSLYLWQQLFLVPSWKEHPLGLIQQWPGNAVAMLVCSLLSYYVVEKPMISIGRKIAGRSLTFPVTSEALVTTGT